jgi:ribulose bisphosphate carboxylase small subunit
MRFHGTATLNEILADVCLEYIKTIYIDEAGERRHLIDEIVGMPANSRMTPNFACVAC